MNAEPTTLKKKKKKASQTVPGGTRPKKSAEKLVRADWETSGGYGSPKLLAPEPTFSSSPSRLRETEFDEPALKTGLAAALSSLPTFNFSSALEDSADFSVDEPGIRPEMS